MSDVENASAEVGAPPPQTGLTIVGFGDVPESLNGAVPGNRIVSVIFTRDGRRLIAGGGTRIVLWDLLFQHDTEPDQIITVDDRITGMDINPPTNQLFCVSSGTGLVHQFEGYDLKPTAEPLPYQLWALHPHQPMIRSADDRVIVAEPQSPLVKCLSLPDGTEQFSISLKAAVTAIDLSSDATVLALGIERRLRLYDGQTGEFLREMIRP